MGAMLYLLALLLPPLAILLGGRPVLGLLVFLIWLPAVLLSGGLGHPAFVALAWILLFLRDQERARRRP